MERNLRLLCAALAVSILAACSRGPVHNAGAQTLRVAVFADVKTLNPLLDSTTNDGFVQRFTFEPLISANARGEPVPILAAEVPSRENRGIGADGLTVTYHLRRNARWSDGVPVTAADVKFSWQAIMNPQNDIASRHGYDDVQRIDTPDRYTVVVHLKQPFAPFITTFFGESDQGYDVVPAHVLAKYPNINHVSFDSDPTVTDGPFTFVSWSHGDRVVLKANDDFFLGKPHLRRIIIEVVPNEDTEINLLQTHAVDYMLEPSIATYPAMKAARGVHIVWVNVNGYEGMAFNLNRSPLSDPRVRLALAYGIDKQKLLDTLTFGQEKIATEDLPDWMWASNPALHPLPYDPGKARALLRAAGVRLPLQLLLVTDTGDVTHAREAVQLQALLRKIGVAIEVKMYPADLLYAPAGAGGVITGGKFDLALFPWFSGIDPDDSAQFSCVNAAPHGWNVARYCNREMDALQKQALTHYDRPARERAYHSIQAMLARDNPLVFFWWRRQAQALSVDLHGFAPNPVTESWNAWEWSL